MNWPTVSDAGAIANVIVVEPRPMPPVMLALVKLPLLAMSHPPFASNRIQLPDPPVKFKTVVGTPFASTVPRSVTRLFLIAMDELKLNVPAPSWTTWSPGQFAMAVLIVPADPVYAAIVPPNCVVRLGIPPDTPTSPSHRPPYTSRSAGTEFAAKADRGNIP